MSKIVSGVLRAAQFANSLFAETCKVKGLTLQQARVLVVVYTKPGLSQTDIVAATGIDRSTVADMVRRMTAGRLLKRVRVKDDKRSYAVTLTDKGGGLVTAALAAIRETERKLVDGMPQAKAFA